MPYKKLPLYVVAALATMHEGRPYHDWRHVRSMLGLLDRHLQWISRADRVHAAICAHDCVYDSRRSDNEERSAEVAMEKFEGLFAPEDLEWIRLAILATKNHAVPPGMTDKDAADLKFLIDADLSILGADEATFDAYDAAVRKEYGWVSDHDWAVGRARVLEGFLSRDRIFTTEPMYADFETRARVNLEMALHLLRSRGQYAPAP